MPKETFFHGDLPLESGLAARARCLGFLAEVAAVSRPRSSATATMQLYFRRSRAHDLRLAVHDHELNGRLRRLRSR